MDKVKGKIRSFLNEYFNNGSVDIVFFLSVIALLTIGLFMLYSASYPSAANDPECDYDPQYYIKRQVFFAVAGVLVMMLFSFIKVDLWKKCTWIVQGISLFLLVIVLFLPEVKEGFHRWIKIPGFGTFQPSEIAKFAVVLAGAYIYSKYATRMSSKKLSTASIPSKANNLWSNTIGKLKICPECLRNGIVKESWVPTWIYVPVFVLFGVLVYAENHLSGCILVLCLGVSMMFIGGVRKRWFALGLAVVMVVMLMVCVPIYQNIKAEDEAIAAAEAAGEEYVAAEESDEEYNFVFKLLRGYMERRIVAWLDKDFEPNNARFQTNQGLYAIGSGGLFGKGLGDSTQKYNYVPESQNDMIFAIVCEELGFIRASGIILIYLLLIYRGVAIGLKAKTRFGGMLAMGIAFQIGLQVILNIAVVTDSIPNTGISLPFFSYGGSSILVLLGEMGIVMAVSRESRIKKK